ncbi:MAG TPA: phenazine biosynthesis protein PhzF [Desulfobacteraceae bacterium]|nr:phenazine biosynthesis protein PhzF [Desulfobacteraceae bacterium]
MTKGKLMRYSAFSTDPAGGNPAGVWIGESLPSTTDMQAIAKDVGYSETAFIAPMAGAKRTVRYFSPEIEVPFCGHATIASGVALGRMDGPGTFMFSTLAGDIPVSVTEHNDAFQAALTSVEPKTAQATPELIDDVLDKLNWNLEEIDRAIPPMRAYAGAWHLVIAAAQLDRLNRLDYDYEGLKALMMQEGFTTLQLIWRETDLVFHSRNPFPVGGVVEDPATGAAAAALGGYLREKGLVTVPQKILIRQGEAMGRPSRLDVEIPENGGIVVSGTAVELKG